MIYNISVITITITMSIILANFGKYAISDCPFIKLFAKRTNPSLLCRVVRGVRFIWAFMYVAQGKTDGVKIMLLF